MAIGWIYLKYLHSRGVFCKGSAKILDIGCQNLFSIPEDEGLSFVLGNRAVHAEEELRDAIRKLSARSTWPKGIGEPVYFFEFAALSGLNYLAYDIFPGEKIKIFDLNLDPVPDDHRGRFDCVLILGRLNTSSTNITHSRLFTTWRASAAICFIRYRPQATSIMDTGCIVQEYS